MQINDEYIKYLCTFRGITAYHMKVLLLLALKPSTQAEIGRTVGLNRQNSYRAFTFLRKAGLIEFVRRDGSAKIFRTITDISRLKKFENTQLKGQIALEDLENKE